MHWSLVKTITIEDTVEIPLMWLKLNVEILYLSLSVVVAMYSVIKLLFVEFRWLLKYQGRFGICLSVMDWKASMDDVNVLEKLEDLAELA